MMLLLRHSYRLFEPDGAIPWNSLVRNFEGFETTIAG